MLIPKPLILFIDAYDSFSNNIISLLESTLNATVRTVKIDDPALLTDEALYNELRNYAAVVCGPGPGHPANQQDVGLMRRIWRLQDREMLPVLGICLGFQSLCLEFGAEIKRLKGPQHGMIRRVSHVGKDKGIRGSSIFEGVEDLDTTLYHSLCADIRRTEHGNDGWEGEKWRSTKQCPDILPLAWVESDLSVENDSGIMDSRVLVAVKHRRKPFWGLQYHPESICTNHETKKVIINWFKEAIRYNRSYRRQWNVTGTSLIGDFATRESLLSRFERLRPMLNGSASFPVGNHSPMGNRISHDVGDEDNILYTQPIALNKTTSVVDIMESLKSTNQDHILLESGNAYVEGIPSDVRGRYSIIALDIDNSVRFEYTTGSYHISAIYPTQSGSKRITDKRPFGGVWAFLAQYLEKRRISSGNKDSPFWGGFMGYTTYELGLEGIDVQSQGRAGKQQTRPDLCLTWVTRSLVIDHVKNLIYIQELAPRCSGHIPNFTLWAKKIATLLSQVRPTPPPSITKQNATANLPRNSEYEAKVRLCQEYIRAGDSYELCLTDQTHLTRPRTTNSSWPLYRALRARQPAPFASYLRLGGLTLVSASPERFLSWNEQAGTCELRPMKGTVKKSPSVQTLAQAKKLLDVPKEKAENLMIVDLVRHDLHGVCGSGNVDVPRLMVVEEYASVFQMISIVRGRIPRYAPSSQNILASLGEEMDEEPVKREEDVGSKTRYTGIDVLSASLPPGSMTGAPKKRSCEILQSVEQGRERSLYSGVVGYMDVGGRGDWSVTIRSMYRWDDEDSIKEGLEGEEEGGTTMETWHIGAGGAVTVLSTDVGEREEMQTKLAGTLGVFGL